MMIAPKNKRSQQKRYVELYCYFIVGRSGWTNNKTIFVQHYYNNNHDNEFPIETEGEICSRHH